jgi:peroxiredoxin
MRWRTVVLLGLVALLPVVARAGTPSPIGRKIDGFSGRDFRGKPTALTDFAQAKLVVVAFLGVECPLAKLYAPRLTELAAEFESKGVSFVGVDSNRQDSVTEMAYYARAHKITFPIVKDVGNVIADQFGAIRTPEVFVLDGERVVRYWGRVDDQFGFQGEGIAYQRNQPQRRDLAVALEELLASKTVSRPTTVAQGCHIGRIKQPLATSDVTYAKDIAPLLNSRCVACHREGQIGPFPLTSYDEVAGWAEMMREVVQQNRMPPWDADPHFGKFKNDSRLSDREKDLLYAWVKNGAPEGDPKDLPEPPRFAEGWMIPKPDAIIYMREVPFDVPAQGTIDYQRFVVDPGWTEDKWVKAIECRPGNAAVVHHIIVYLVPPNVTPSGRAGRLQSNMLGGFAPGLCPLVLPKGMARYVQKGSKLLFEIHYTANGTVQQDRSYAGFVFADGGSVRKEVAVQNAGNLTFKIPPHESNFKVESEYRFAKDALLLSLTPHMHLRGKDFRYDLIYPDGKTETILWVPRYDFGWQTTYEFADPKRVPRGTTMHCTAHFDNSEENLANPDPSIEVAWGEQTWDEMMFGWFDMALGDQDLTKPASESALRVKEFLAQAADDGVRLNDQIKTLARQALKSHKDFELLSHQLFDLIPQLDRVCVTAVEGDHLRLRLLHQRLGLKTTFRSTSTLVKAAGQSLADYALADKPIINADLTGTTGSVMSKMSAYGIMSSMHVPIQFEGRPATVNFWSSEVGAFPPQAARLLEQVVRLMADGNTDSPQVRETISRPSKP